MVGSEKGREKSIERKNRDCQRTISDSDLKSRESTIRNGGAAIGCEENGEIKFSSGKKNARIK